ncbi:hypothetical protein E2C01_017749 [Portunus trituberculatus]|uniref:Uncharacterized protein n=1 Tax=Portunus trituberculatus TaxID=210409 RepID=A0A5B7DST1_PORTR|nr:hypothetical protein [Portunus trituberculatus]
MAEWHPEWTWHMCLRQVGRFQSGGRELRDSAAPTSRDNGKSPLGYKFTSPRFMSSRGWRPREGFRSCGAAH